MTKKESEKVEREMPKNLKEYLNEEYDMWYVTDYDGEWYEVNIVDDGESKSCDFRKSDFE